MGIVWIASLTRPSQWICLTCKHKW
jgi:hypothetical protein